MATQKTRPKRKIASPRTSKGAEDVAEISRRMLRYASAGPARIDFLREVSKILMEFSRCDAVELRLRDPDLYFRWEAVKRPKRAFRFVIMPNGQAESGAIIRIAPDSGLQDSARIEQLRRDVVRGRFDSASPFFTSNGSFWRGDTREPLRFGSRHATKLHRAGAHRPERVECLMQGGRYRSLALVRFAVDDKTVGLLQLSSIRRHHFTREEIELYEDLAQTLGLAIANRRAQWALRERVKELTCLYGIARIAQRPGISLGEALQGIVELLPQAWQYPEIARARIILDERSYATVGFQQGRHRQTADIMVGVRRGVVEVVYLRDKADFVEGPFLREEQSLIDTIAKEVALIIERREGEDQRSKLQDQLRHADRLATIGQLAAGLAHELNEPLGNILGFAQLAGKDASLSKQAANDMEKIVRASLHVREVIHNLLIFARQTLPLKARVNLNEIVEVSLSFLESRCAKAGIELVRTLTPDLPEIEADKSQLQQVLVNLAVNAVQAMPEGGKLTIETAASQSYISLVVKDTGIGMTEDVKIKIFTPFFTTKDVDQGTGLGLAVVHGIVTSHGGSILVESEVGHGARFEIRLPAAKPAEVKATG
jgi:two-component system NtrC family sensor kinase